VVSSAPSWAARAAEIARWLLMSCNTAFGEGYRRCGVFAGGADAGQELAGGFVGAAFAAGEFGFGGNPFATECLCQRCCGKKPQRIEPFKSAGHEPPGRTPRISEGRPVEKLFNSPFGSNTVGLNDTPKTLRRNIVEYFSRARGLVTVYWRDENRQIRHMRSLLRRCDHCLSALPKFVSGSFVENHTLL
jgi:hypothetical protein